MRHFLIDTDTASDDAVALVMVLREPAVQVEAITVVAGNVGVDQGVQNALYTVELCSGNVPVHRGAGAPLRRPLQTAQHVHGMDGMGDIGLPLRGRKPAAKPAITALLDTIGQFADDITLVTLGPLTNVALALLQDPSMARKVKECYVMGGVGRGPGNVTPVAEYNIWADPEAAKIVFESSLPIRMIGWDIAHTYAEFDAQECAQLRDLGTELAKFCVDIQNASRQLHRRRTGSEGFTLPDPTTMAVALDPSIATRTELLHVAIEIDSELCRGQTVVDHPRVTGNDPNVAVVLEISRPRFVGLLKRALTS